MATASMLKCVLQAAAALPEGDMHKVRAAADVLARSPMTAPWGAFATALDFSVPLPVVRDGRTSRISAPMSVLNHYDGGAALAMLAVRALRRRVLDAGSGARTGQWLGRPTRGEGELLYERRRLLRSDAEWNHVAALRSMLPALANAERPVAALAERLLQSGEAQVWWALGEHELRSALDSDRLDVAVAASPPDDVQDVIERTRKTLATALGVSPQRILITVAF